MAEPSSTPRVLIADDDPAIRAVLSALLTQAGIGAQGVEDGLAALEALASGAYEILITDLRMPRMDGMELLAKTHERWPELPVVMLTAHGTVADAVEAMKRGAAEFVQKPFDREEILYVVRKALTRAEAAERVDAAPARSAAGVVGSSEAMREVHALIRKAAAGTATVLIRGESGTGKELAARAVHAQSARKDKPFVKLHCAALPETLLESELFGYEKGAFTGAASRKPGRVELAQGGTLFLDEIGDIPPAIQVKLLRVLQEREFERLGGTQTLKADLRFVAATHRNLEEMVKAGTFREDLFYRLNVVPVWLPPLRDRPEDLEPLATLFCATLGAANGKPDAHLTPEAMGLLASQGWPGNVRQLENFIERLVVLGDQSELTFEDVRRELNRTGSATGLAPAAGTNEPSSSAETLDVQRGQAEREALLGALHRAHDNRTLAARLLGVSRRTLYNKLQEHGLT